MRVFLHKFSKQDLKKLSADERSLVLLLGHVCNELAFLNKLIVVASDTDKEGIERLTMTAQSMIVARLFIGKVFEGWRMLGKQYFGSDLRDEFDPLLPNNVQESLTTLNKTFGSKNLLSKFRNKFSFHYGSEHIEEVLDLLTEDYQFSVISAGTHDSTLYSFSEDVATFGMLNETGLSSPREAMDKVIDTLIRSSGALLDYASELLNVILRERLGIAPDQPEWEEHEIQVEADLETFRMPFFFNRAPLQ